MVRGRDACWEHCVLVDATRQKVRCNYCQREFSGGVYRMKFHLAQIRNKDVVPCTEVPNNVRDHIKSILRTPKKRKPFKRQKLVQAANGQAESSSGSGGVGSNHLSSGQRGSASSSPLCLRPSPTEPPAVDNALKQKWDSADKKIAAFFFHHSLPFSAAKSIFYQEMVDAIADCGLGYKAPTYDYLKSDLLEKVKCDVKDYSMKLSAEWKETGCTIFCDCLSDGRTKLLVLSVACCKGAIFLRSTDVTAHADDAQYLFALLESVVLEVGIENVVQVITDNDASYVFVGRLLMEKYPSVFWSPCASLCINKMLQDLSKLEWVRTVLEEADSITRYIYGNNWILTMTRKFTGGMELTRPKISGLVNRFLSLRSLMVQEDNLRKMFSHVDWLSSIHNRHPDAQNFKSLLYQERFWKSAQEAVNISGPFLKLLRLIDGDMPAMGYMYEGLERAKAAVKAYYNGVEEKYMPVWDIIDRRWNMQPHSSLYAAAAFLNPSIFYNLNFKSDSQIRNGFQEVMMKMFTEDKDQIQLIKEHPKYVSAHGALGTDFAIKGRTLNMPGDWWAVYGYEIPALQRAAMRILNQPCSNHWCRWNWSTFQTVHFNRHNKMEVDKFDDLVFVRCNLWLQAIVRSQDRKNEPVNFEEIDINSVWPTESEAPHPVTYDSWLVNLPITGKGNI